MIEPVITITISGGDREETGMREIAQFVIVSMLSRGASYERNTDPTNSS
jgi:hypothetical protein